MVKTLQIKAALTFTGIAELKQNRERAAIEIMKLASTVLRGQRAVRPLATR